MRTSTIRKMNPSRHTLAKSAEVFDFARLAQVQVAVESEKACHLSGNIEAPDFEEFMLRYGIRPTGDFE